MRLGDLSVVEPGRTFDLVVALEVLEHIEDDHAAARDWVGRLRPGGSLVLSTPAYQRRYGPMDAMVGHYRRYEPAALATLLRAAGLDDVTVRHYGVPLAYAIEPVRNIVARRRSRSAPSNGDRVGDVLNATTDVPGGDAVADAVQPSGPSMAERTGTSGRTLQPRGWAAGLAVQIATAPAKAVQRRFPQHGPALVVIGRRGGR